MNQKEKDLEGKLHRYLGLFGAPSPDQIDASRERILERLGEQAATSSDQASSRLRREKSAGKIWRWSLSAAAAVTVAVLIFTNVVRRGDALARVEIADGQWGDEIQVGQAFRSNDMTGSIIVLSDGSRVEMRTQSELSLDRASDGVRIHLKKGGVIVNAAKQGAGHLYVQTKDVTVSVVGTVFLVNAEETGSRVAVIEGEVRVQQ
jgi:ferric-dicitrate binding protein FerR (iron transport regulator)